MDFFNDLKNEFDPKSDGFIGSITHDDTFRSVTGTLGGTLTGGLSF